MLGDPVPPEAMHIILEAYLRVLQEADQRDLIALYAAALGKNAVERYATFLVSLELTGDREERRTSLTRANEHKLDVHLVALRAAELSVTKAFTVSAGWNVLLLSSNTDSHCRSFQLREAHFQGQAPCSLRQATRSCSYSGQSNG